VWINWIESGWVNEFTVMVLSVEGSLSGLTNNDELVNGLSVLKVLVEIILEVLDGIHVLLDKVISSDLLEWEGVVVKLPSVNSGCASDWFLTLLLELSVDVHGIVVMMLIEASGEVVELNIQLLLGDWKWVVADCELESLGVSIKEVFAIFEMVNNHVTSVPSIGFVISAGEVVFTLLKWAVLSWLFTIVVTVSILLAVDANGIFSFSSD
jgi:hypothetical protein